MRPEHKKKIEQREIVLQRVNELLITSLKLNLSSKDLDPETPLFATGLGLDSVDAVVIIVELESEFEISISEEESWTALRTINSLTDLILSKMNNETEK
jgi:acyl carrier protein